MPSLIKKIASKLRFNKRFEGSEKYWKNRYRTGGNSGMGSYNQYAEFKAEIINEFIKRKNIQSVIEFGCGDGNQLKYLNYQRYWGFDISEDAIGICKKMFRNDSSKSFGLSSEYQGQKAELGLSLDVIYHLIEDEVYYTYMNQLFNSATKYIIIYASNTNFNHSEIAPHVKNRMFTDWVKAKFPAFELKEHIPNRYPLKGKKSGSISDFYIFENNTE